ncbi:MAG: hypothetical protein JNK15_16500 [Planctomycetes bacterium]|nr:hypothetical protein [Planctomycetota bacterium]
MNGRAVAAGRGMGVSAAIAVLAAVAFTLLRQRALHGEDTRLFVLGLAAGDTGWLSRHFLFLPTIQGLGAVLRPFGASWFVVLQTAAIAGSALGLFCLHRAGRRLLGADVGHWLPIALALVPGWFFFATAAEIHGLFVLPLGVAWWAFAAWHDVPGRWRAVAVGVGCGVAAALHFTGYALLPTLLLLAFLRRRQPVRTCVGLCAWSGLGLVGAVVLAALAVGVSPWGQFTAAAEFGEAWSVRVQMAEVPRVGWTEFVRPFLPWSFLVVPACFVPSARPYAVGALLAMGMHAPTPLLGLANAERLVEHGAYLTACAVPLVLAAWHTVPRWAFAGSVVVAAVVANGLQAGRRVVPYDPAMVASLRALQQERGPLALVVGSRSADMEALTIECEGQLFIDTDKVRVWTDGASGVPLAPWFDAIIAHFASGRQLVVCASARAAFAQHAHPEVRALWADHLARAYVVEPIVRPGLEAWLLTRR